MKKLSLLCLAAILLSACRQPIPEAHYDIIPQPHEVGSSFTLQEETMVYYQDGLQREAQFLSEYVNDIIGYALNQQAYQDQTDGIVLKVVPEDFEQSEAYEINVTPKQVIV